jgi:hypothetical protein
MGLMGLMGLLFLAVAVVLRFAIETATGSFLTYTGRSPIVFVN